MNNNKQRIRYFNALNKLASGLFLLLLLTSISHAQVIGEVLRSENMPQYPAGMKITQQSEIKTGAKQKISIKTEQGDVLVAGQNASIKLVKPGFFSHFFGKIFYFIAPRKMNEVQVQTATATIGIRGTKFIINTAESDVTKERVSLAEGQLSFESNDEEYFQLYRQRELTEFEKYKREQQAEFEQFKQQMAEEFVAYKASINLDAGYALQFDGKKATRIALDPHITAEFEEFEQFIADNQRH